MLIGTVANVAAIVAGTIVGLSAERQVAEAPVEDDHDPGTWPHNDSRRSQDDNDPGGSSGSPGRPSSSELSWANGLASKGSWTSGSSVEMRVSREGGDIRESIRHNHPTILCRANGDSRRASGRSPRRHSSTSHEIRLGWGFIHSVRSNVRGWSHILRNSRPTVSGRYHYRRLTA